MTTMDFLLSMHMQIFSNNLRGTRNLGFIYGPKVKKNLVWDLNASLSMRKAKECAQGRQQKPPNPGGAMAVGVPQQAGPRAGAGHLCRGDEERKA